MRHLLACLILLCALVTAPLNAHAQSDSGLNYQNADLRVFIKDIAQETGLTFIIDPRARQSRYFLAIACGPRQLD